jgi:hypothetical protein
VVGQPMRIGIVGTHSTGKTTLLRRIEMELRAVGVSVARTPGRLAARAAGLGFPKLHHQTPATTEWIITSGIADELQASLAADVVLADRAAPDPMAYYLAALGARGDHGEPDEINRLRRLVTLHAESYTLLLATVLDPDIPLGQHRDRDPVYRARVHDHLHQLIAGIPHQRVTSDSDSQDRAVQAALAAAAVAAVESSVAP